MARLLLDHIDDRQKPSHVTVAGYIKNWEAGTVRITDPRYRAAYAAVLDIPEDELFSVETQRRTLDSTVIPDEGDDDVERRALLQLLASLGAGAALPISALESLRGDLETTLNTGADVEEWERIAWEYGHTYVSTPPGRLVADLAADVADVRRLLSRTTKPAVRARLARVSAQLLTLMADGLHSFGVTGASQRWWRTARHAADASGDPDIAAWVRARESFNALHSGRAVRSALLLAEDAVRIAGNRPSLGVVEAHKNRAYALARQGDADQSRKAVDAMRTAFERLPEEVVSETGSLWGWPERILYLAEGYVSTMLGDPAAVAAQDKALATYPAEWRTDVAKIHLLRAITLVQDREVEAGLEHAVTVMETVPSDRRRGSVLHLAAKVTENLPGQAHILPAARELRALTAGV
ncbi:XRE family transcriptional regulator [Thermomonospora amylolytica]|uniref:XRE family transcriptional regulator n=1 Tax=Thermomonospora amylolytica TaxID=1411117 RepID=UPI000E6C17D9|nr:XRE family transcriptional regulator [Thermomonospora amylolytica]